MLVAHLAEDRIQALFASEHVRIETTLRQPGADGFGDLADHFAAVAARRLHRALEHPVTQGIHGLERQILQLAVHRMQTQPVGDGRMDLQRFAGNAPLLVLAHATERAHVVRAIRQLDQDDAHVARHRHKHLAEIFGLRVFLRLELDLVELGHTIHQFGDHLAEALGNLRLGDFGVFHHIVQQRRTECLTVQLPPGQDFGNRHRVRHIGLAARAELPGMRTRRKLVRVPHALHVFFAKIGRDAGDQAIDVAFRKTGRDVGARIVVSETEAGKRQCRRQLRDRGRHEYVVHRSHRSVQREVPGRIRPGRG